MTRQELLEIIVHRARDNGFAFRKWFQATVDPSWAGYDAAIRVLAQGRRYYSLLFSHEFALCFWKQGTQMLFIVPAASYTRKDKGGKVITVTRKAFTRRTLKADVWKYHLREMAAHEEPLRYIRRFLPTEEDVQKSPEISPSPAGPRKRSTESIH